MQRPVRHILLIVTVVLLGSLALVTAVWSQGGGQLVANTVEVEPQPAQCAYQVRAFISVLDANRDPITNLTTDDVTVVEDGAPVSIPADAVRPASEGMAIVVAIDKSGSMDRQDKMPAAKQAVNDFLLRLEGRKDQIAIYSFDDKIDLEADWTDDPVALINQAVIDSITIEPFAGTCLYDAAFKAVEKAAEVRKGRRAVVLLTDGIDEARGGGSCSSKTIDDVIDRAQELSVPLFLIGLGNEDIDPQALQRIAGLTNGQFWLAPRSSDLGHIYQQIAAQLKNQLLLSYLSSGASGEHTLVIKARIRGQQTTEGTVTFNAPAMPPVITGISVPEEVSGAVLVRPSVPCPANVARVEFYVDRNLVGEAMAPPFELEWDPSALAPGQHELRVVLWNAQDQQAEQTVSIDVRPPTPTPTPNPPHITDPGLPPDGTTVKGSVSVQPQFDSPEGVSLVRLNVDGQLREEIQSPPFEFNWDTRAESNGDHTVEVEVQSPEGLVAQSQHHIIVKNGGASPLLFVVPLFLVLMLAGGLVAMRRRRRSEADLYAEEVVILDDVSGVPTGDVGEELPTEDVGLSPLGGAVATLTVLRSVELPTGEVFELYPVSATVGRSDDNDILIPDRPVSREHAEIRYENGEFYIYDLKSKFGTRVNGERIVPFEEALLRDGDRIQIGTRTEFEFRRLATEGLHETSDISAPEETRDVSEGEGMGDIWKTEDVEDYDS